jgi:peptidoglycan/xylan/chitin deacetylase (PgdA/CDA1 family)
MGPPAVKRAIAVTAKSVFALADIVNGDWPGPRILTYHQVGAELGRQMEVPTEVFIRHLDWLVENGDVLDLETAISRRAEFDAHRLFTLGFDDGYADLYTTAFPLLASRSLPFTLYLTTNPTETSTAMTPGGQAEPLTWNQVRAMADSGLMTLGAHTHTHRDLRGVPEDVIVEELDESNRLIEERCGTVPRHFAYPKGYWDPVAERLIAERYESATLGAGPPVTGETDPLRLHRVAVQKSDGMVFFKRKIKSGMRWEERTRRRVRNYQGPP